MIEEYYDCDVIGFIVACFDFIVLSFALYHIQVVWLHIKGSLFYLEGDFCPVNANVGTKTLSRDFGYLSLTALS